MRVVSVAEMVEIEKKANNAGLSYAQMMRNAGRSIADVILQRYSTLSKKTALGLVGSGNNGGDTLIALANLQKAGWQTTALIVKDRGNEDPLIRELEDSGADVFSWQQDDAKGRLITSMGNAEILLDGILGTGIKLPLRGAVPPLLSLVKKRCRNIAVIAVDCPSGVDCDSGEVAPEVLKAELTICMAALKQGLLKQPAAGLVGEIVYGDIGLDDEIIKTGDQDFWAADAVSVSALFPDRPADAHKGTFGRCLVIGGSTQYPGAPILSAESAFRIGAGLVCTGIPSEIYDGVINQLRESIWLLLPHDMGFLVANAANVIFDHMDAYNTVLIGPGLGLDKRTIDFLKAFLAFDSPAGSGREIGFTANRDLSEDQRITQPHLVIDADALRTLKHIPRWNEKIEKPAVLTPHPGEMADLTGLAKDEIQANRMEVAKKFAGEWGHVVVLKGAGTVVAGPDGKSAIIPISTPALATAGSGDVLAGMIAGLIAQGTPAFESAVASAWIHGAAGLSAQRAFGQDISVMAGDILAHVPKVLKEITAC